MNDPPRREGTSSRAPLWTRVVIESSPGACEEIAAFLAELTGRGVESAPVPGTGRGERERVVGYLENSPPGRRQRKGLDDFLTLTGERDPEASPRVVRSEPVRGEDWLERWKSHFRPARITPRLVVRPPWEEYLPAAGEQVIVIDPGMAFGTGLHASTRLTLDFIDDSFAATEGGASSPGGTTASPPGVFPSRVLDVGTGTGILAVACALLGAREVIAVDSDPQALREAEKNVSRNGVEDRVVVAGKDLAEVEGTFDLIAANILYDTLAALAGALEERLKTGGTLLCAGILAGKQEEELERVFARLGLRCVEKRTEEEWAALRLARKAWATP